MATSEIKLFWPTSYGVITQPFGARPEYYKQFGLPGHEGLDIQAPHGSPIYACADGSVKLVVNSSIAGGNYGVQVRLLHGAGVAATGTYETIYAHMLETTVKEGQLVYQGDVIGYADNTGNSQGNHLHLTLKVYGDYAQYAAKGYGGSIANPTPFMMKFGEKPMRNLACGNVIQIGLSDDEVLSITARLRPEFMTVTSRPALAAKLIAQGVKVIYRRWPDDGANAHNFLSNPEGFVDWVAAEAPAGAILSLPNEPGAATRELGKATLRALQRATAIGRIASFGNFATGTPEPEDWQHFAAAIEYAYVYGHILNLHEYWFPNPLTDYTYHVGRFLEIYKQFGVRVPRIVMGEIGYAKQYDPHQGWYNNIPPDEMARHLRVVHSLYKKYNIAYCVFSLGHWPTHGEAVTGDFDVAQSSVIMQALYDALGDLPMTVALPPGSVTYNGRVAKLPGTLSYVNIRSGPSTSYGDIGDLKQNDTIVFSAPPQYPGWYWLRLGALEGWVIKTIGGQPLVIENLSAPAPYDPLQDLKDIRTELSKVITKLEG